MVDDDGDTLIMFGVSGAAAVVLCLCANYTHILSYFAHFIYYHCYFSLILCVSFFSSVLFLCAQ